MKKPQWKQVSKQHPCKKCYYLVKINQEILVTNATNETEALLRAIQCLTLSNYSVEERDPEDF